MSEGTWKPTGALMKARVTLCKMSVIKKCTLSLKIKALSGILSRTEMENHLTMRTNGAKQMLPTSHSMCPLRGYPSTRSRKTEHFLLNLVTWPLNFGWKSMMWMRCLFFVFYKMLRILRSTSYENKVTSIANWLISNRKALQSLSPCLHKLTWLSGTTLPLDRNKIKSSSLSIVSFR